MKKCDFAERNEKDIQLFKKRYSRITLQRYTCFEIQLRKLYSIFKFEEKRQ